MAKRKSTEKAIKKFHPAYLVIIALALIVGVAIGYFAGSYMYGKDTLVLNGEKTVYIEDGQTVLYTDEGIKYISGGKDMSDKVDIETNMTLVDGKYTGTPDAKTELYIIYKITEGRAAGQTLYRVFKIQEDGGAA